MTLDMCAQGENEPCERNSELAQRDSSDWLTPSLMLFLEMQLLSGDLLWARKSWRTAVSEENEFCRSLLAIIAELDSLVIAMVMMVIADCQLNHCSAFEWCCQCESAFPCTRACVCPLESLIFLAFCFADHCSFFSLFQLSFFYLVAQGDSLEFQW